MRFVFPIALSGLLAAPVSAADLNLKIEIPRLNVAEYHRPYVAVWIEQPDQDKVTNLLVWYDHKLARNEGTKWLKDMRQWWRRTGRELTMPADGLSGATRPVGEHQIAFAGNKAPLTGLPAGSYQLMIEAAREVGGRELLRVPFQWPPASEQTMTAKGEHEIGAVSLTLKP